jgi:CheY-like chemotaxis protein
VDDEPVNLRVLKNHLEKEGYHVTMAQNGFDALAIAGRGSFLSFGFAGRDDAADTRV